MTKRSPFRYFKTSPEIIRLAVMMYVRFPLSLRNVEDLLHERGIDISHETVRFWWNRFGPMFAAEIRRKRVQQLSRNNGARTSRCHWLVRRSIPVSSKDIKKRGWHPLGITIPVHKSLKLDRQQAPALEYLYIGQSLVL